MLLVLALALFVAACGGEGAKPKVTRAFCNAADDYEREINREARKGTTDNVDRQLPLVERLADTAPKPIKPQAEKFLDAMRRVQDDPSIKGDPDIEKAVQDVIRYAAQGCGVYNQQNGI